MPRSEYADQLGMREVITRELVGQIEKGLLPEGTKLKATQDIAKQFGVATNTAQAAIAELCNRGLVSRAPRRGTVVSVGAAARLSAKTCTIGLEIECHAGIHIWGEFTKVLLQGLRDLPVQLILLDSTDISPEKLLQLNSFESLVNAAPRIIIAQHRRAVVGMKERCPQSHVICLEPMTGKDRLVDVIAPDYEQVGCLAARHLLSCGYSRIACLLHNIEPGRKHPLLRHEDKLMLAGMDGILAAAGLNSAERIIVDAGVNSGGVLARRFAALPPPQAVYCPLTHRAVELVKHLREAKLVVPGDVAVLAGSNTPYAEDYGLTAIDLGYSCIARHCLDVVRNVIESGFTPDNFSTHSVLPEIAVRSSTRQPCKTDKWTNTILV